MKTKFKFPSLHNLKIRRLNKAIEDHELNKKYYELNEEILSYKKLSKQGKFSKAIIVFCLTFLAIFSLLCLYVQYKTGYDASALLTIVASVFGVELLFLLFKRIFATEDKSISTFIPKFNKKETNTTVKEESSETIEDIVSEVNKNIDGGLG